MKNNVIGFSSSTMRRNKNKAWSNVPLAQLPPPEVGITGSSAVSRRKGNFRKQCMSNGSYKPFPRSSCSFLLTVGEAWVAAWIAAFPTGWDGNGMKISHVEGDMRLTVIFKRYLFFALIILRVTNTNTDLHWKQLNLDAQILLSLIQTWTLWISQIYV